MRRIKISPSEAASIGILSARPEWDVFIHIMKRSAYNSGLAAGQTQSNNRESDMLLGDMRTYDAISEIETTAVEILKGAKRQ